jgi:hypothetical protein
VRICCCEKISLTSLDISTRKWDSLCSWSLFAVSNTSYFLRWIKPRITAREEQISTTWREEKRERERERGGHLSVSQSQPGAHPPSTYSTGRCAST